MWPSVAESPMVISTSSSPTPSSSATIWLSVVSVPWPWLGTPKVAVTAPVASTATEAVSVPVFTGMPGAAEMREPSPVSSA